MNGEHQKWVDAAQVFVGLVTLYLACMATCWGVLIALGWA